MMAEQSVTMSKFGEEGRSISQYYFTPSLSFSSHIFWVGDLNYRIQEPPGQQRPGPLSDAQTYELLLQYDQLRQEMRRGKCFEGYTEGEIKFRPTYKYDPGTDNYDSSEKQRAPAYCDRVLWKGTRIEQLAYNSIMEIRQSDHKPVYAVFQVKVKTRDEVKYKRVQEEVLKAVDKRENDNQPQINVEKTVIDFGTVRFNEPSTRDFNVYNNCPLPVDFSFKEKDIHAICEPWLHVDPRQDSLLIDSARSIRLKMNANVRTIAGLLRKIRASDNFDILILHVENGRDIFITVTGDYQPSCFGLSMETMCRTDRPLSEYSQDQIKQLVSSLHFCNYEVFLLITNHVSLQMNDESPEYRVTMPREFFLLIDYLYRQGSKQVGAFPSYDSRLSLGAQFNSVRDWLDTWSDDPFRKWTLLDCHHNSCEYSLTIYSCQRRDGCAGAAAFAGSAGACSAGAGGRESAGVHQQVAGYGLHFAVKSPQAQCFHAPLYVPARGHRESVL